MTNDDQAPTIRIVSHNANAAEVAAVTATLQGALAEGSGVDADAARSTPSAWERSQRHIRTTLVPGPGHWRGFTP